MSFAEEIKKDLKINKAKLDEESSNSPLLIQKYLDKYYLALKELGKVQIEYDRMYAIKVEFYRTSYKFIPETMKELEILISGDVEFSKIKEKLNTQNIMVSYLKDLVQQFRDRQWAIKNTIEFLKMTSGMAL